MDHFWQLPALGGPDEPILEAYTLARRARGAHRTRAARHARHRRDVPQSRRCSPRWSRRSTSSRRAAPSSGSAPRGTSPSTTASASTSRARANDSTASRKRCRSAARCSATTTDLEGPLLLDRRRAQRAAPDPARRPADHDRRQRREAHAPARRAVRRHVQRVAAARRRSRTSSTCCARHCKDVGRDPSEITTTRLGTLVLTNDADETAAHDGVPSGLAGDEFDEQFTVGEPDDVVAQGRHAGRRGPRLPDLQHAAVRARHGRPRRRAPHLDASPRLRGVPPTLAERLGYAPDAAPADRQLRRPRLVAARRTSRSTRRSATAWRRPARR